MISGVGSDSLSASLLAELFRKLDTDGISAISGSGMVGAAGSGSAMAERLASMDTDGDGQMAQMEFTSAAQSLDTKDMPLSLAAAS